MQEILFPVRVAQFCSLFFKYFSLLLNLFSLQIFTAGLGRIMHICQHSLTYTPYVVPSTLYSVFQYSCLLLKQDEETFMSERFSWQQRSVWSLVNAVWLMLQEVQVFLWDSWGVFKTCLIWMWHITLFRFVRTFIYFIFNLIINNVVYSLFNNIKNILLLKNRKKLIVTSSDLVIRSLWEQRPSCGRSRNYKNSKGLEKQHKHYFLLAILVKVIVFDQSTTAWLCLILF